MSSARPAPGHNTVAIGPYRRVVREVSNGRDARGLHLIGYLLVCGHTVQRRNRVGEGCYCGECASGGSR